MTRLPLLLAIILAAAALLLLGAMSRDAGAATYGDADCSGKIAPDDALAVLIGDAPCADLADVNCDGHADETDAVRILAHLAGVSVAPVAGCPPIGSETTTPSPSEHVGPSFSPPPGPTNTPTPTATPTATSPTTATPTATPSPTAQPAPGQTPQAGGEPDCQVFPADNWWNTDISNYPVHANSDDFVDNIGRWTDLHPDFGTVWDGKPIGIPYVIVGAGQPKVPITYYYDDSDPGPYPIPPDVPVEGQPVGQPNTAGFGGDRHVIVVDESTCTLYETYDSHPVNGGQSWDTGSAAIFDLDSNALRPDTWTSADAAGLPIFAGLVRYSEVVEEGEIEHALRFTVSETRRAFIHPATHYASDLTDADLPPMGLRFRMKSTYDCSWARSEVQVVCAALKKYGMFVADNGADWYISGAPDPRWDDDRIGDLKDIPGDAFEAVETGEAVITG